MSVAWLVLPDFLLILLGWLLHHRLGFSREFFTGLEKLVYYVLFPALLFQSILKTPISPATAGDTLMATAALVVVGFTLARFGGWLLKANPLALASSTQCAFRFNTYLGLALAPSLGGASGQTIMALILGLSIPMVNVAAVYALAKQQGSNVFGALIRNPLFLATVLGLIGNLAGLQLPGPIDTTVGRLGVAAIALGILCIGPSLSWQGGQGAGGLVTWMVSVKLLIMPAAAWLIAWLIGFDPLATQMLVLFAALPCATAAYVLAVRMGGDGRLVSFIISVGTLLSALTIPIWMTLVR
ncbi:MAG: AEC family transporter [Orrella sp.]